MKKGTDYTLEEAYRVESYLSDFDGDVPAWENAFYELWRYHMTYSFAVDIAVYESRKKGVFVSLLVRPAYKTGVLDAMEDLGYRNVSVVEETFAEFDSFCMGDDAPYFGVLC